MRAAEKEVREQIEYTEEFSFEQIEKIIRKMKNKKAPGPGGIKNEAWKNCSWEVIKEFTTIVNNCWSGGGLPEEWRNGLVVPVYKKGEANLPENYRGITLMDTGYKIYAELLKNKLEDALETNHLLDETQFGFRRNRGTSDAIYLVKTAIKTTINKEKGMLFLFLADLKGAFDAVNRQAIWKRLEEIGIDEKLIVRIKEIYDKTYCQLKVNNEIIDQMEIENGVRQGCPISSILFNTVFSDLETEMKKAQEAGIRIGKKKIWSISYADDVVIMADNEVGLSKAIKWFAKYIKSKA